MRSSSVWARGWTGCGQEGERWTIGAGLPAPLAARRTAAAGYRGAAHLRRRAGHGGRRGVHERRLPRRRLVGSGGAGDGGGRSGQDTVLERSEVPFTYRRSGLDGRIVLETTCDSGRRRRPQLDEQIAEMFEWRQRGTPFNQPCCGSVFKNPSGPSWKREGGPRTAGQLIEAAGLKGRAIGGAQVSPMHANYFVNTGRRHGGGRARADRARAGRGRGAVRRAAGAGGEADRAWGEYLNAD